MTVTKIAVHKTTRITIATMVMNVHKTAAGLAITKAVTMKEAGKTREEAEPTAICRAIIAMIEDTSHVRTVTGVAQQMIMTNILNVETETAIIIMRTAVPGMMIGVWTVCAMIIAVAAA
jgi:hypothetical protein